MRKIVTAVVVLGLAAPVWAGPKDKTSETLINPDSIMGSSDWNNTTVATKVKSGKCKIKIQAKDATGVAGADLTCIAEADVRATSLGGGTDTYGNSVILSGAAESDGKIKISANLGAIGCGIQSEAISMNGTLKCYKIKTGTGVGEYDWKTQCAGAGMLPLDPNTVPGTEDVKGGAVVGLCQGLTANGGQRIPPPAVPVLAEQGSYQPLQ